MPVVRGTPEETREQELAICQEYHDRLERELAGLEEVMHGLMRRTIPITEKQFEAQVRQLAHLYGWLCYHTWRSIHSPAGFPDLVLVRADGRPGGNRLIFAELKTVRGKLTAAQQQWLEALRQTAAEVYVWRPDDWDSIVACLGNRYA
jgi:hypothetical protein